MVFKDRQNDVGVNGDNDITTEPPLFDEDQVEAIAAALAQQRQELASMLDQAIAPLRERIAVLEGQIGMLMVMLGNGNNGARPLHASAVCRRHAVRIGRPTRPIPRLRHRPTDQRPTLEVTPAASRVLL